ncbi:MAG: ATP-binding protein, partial [Noviherbaspirillum sp.]
MFHIKSLELVHWDYWQRVKNIPLDAKIITIAGQNGSGKTTLLDALRTLFGLDCSMGRTYKHYARHSGQQSSWLRAVVDNKAVGPQISNRPFRSSGFFSDDEVTLFCQIQKNGGDWKRQYLMRPGAVEIEEVQDASDWLGLESYRKRLASAGLSQAMAKVLALEQGETDKLCEYAPRQLLDLVFQVFGDKEVLDAYDEAKRHQRDTEIELQRFEAELDTSRANLEALRLRAANYHQWEGLARERRDLQEEALPILQYHEAREKAAQESKRLAEARHALAAQDGQLSGKRGELAERAAAHSAAQGREAQLEQEMSGLQQRLAELNARLKPLESLLEQKSRLQQLAADAGADLAEVAVQLEQKEADYLRLRQARQAVAARLAETRGAIAAAEGKAGLPEPDYVRSMRRALTEAGIAHAMLSDIVEVTDPHWQAAVEGVLRSYAFVVLLENAGDAAAAFRLGERQGYGHFIVADRVKAPAKKDQSLLSVVRFSELAPAWLIDQLARITRVDSVEEGMRLGANEEWITPQAWHRERRGGRSLAVEAARFRFGQAGRAQRLAALRLSLPALETEEDRHTLQITRLAGEVSGLKSRLAGVDAAQELAARQAEFEEAGQAAVPLKAARTEVGARLAELYPLIKQATEERTRADGAWLAAKRTLAEAEAHLRLTQKRQREERGAHAEALLQMRRNWRLPAAWRTQARRRELAAAHQNAHQ